jgi:glycosyltransferase involved in cell wall biosynthesis
MKDLEFVSIIIPCRNEEKFIGKCLDSIINTKYPKNKLEVLVVDGMSEDRTRKIVAEYINKYSFIRLLDNPKKIIPTAMNIGIRNSIGEIIMKFDAHAEYQKDYISKCIEYLNKYRADNVGGVVTVLPRYNTTIGKAIVSVVSHPFGVGNSLFRIGPKEPLWADTAFSGCYRRSVFDQIGFYDEEIERSEDMALNSKIRRAGGKILLAPEIVSYYYARSNFIDFCKHNLDNGFWITYPLKYGRILFSWRHLVPLVFVSSFIWLGSLSLFWRGWLWLLLILGGVYILTNLAASVQIVKKEREIRHLLVVPLIFASLHILYGLGSLWGVVKVLGHRASKLRGKGDR